MTELLKRPNPYWDAVVERVRPSRWYGDTGLEAEQFDWIRRHDFDGDHPRDRHDLVGQYAWTITHPESVAFAAAYSRGRVVDPMAGTGYWGYVLGFHGVDVISYDLYSPAENTFHRNYASHMPVIVRDGIDAAAAHPDRTLLLSWPPYNWPIGLNIVTAYRGDRIIYIGEGEGGCCGDDDLHQLLDQRWTQVAEHRPVQWEGMHDYVTVYDRRPQ